MSTINDARIEKLAQSCVDDMGDIFWDFDPVRDAAGEYSNPRDVAVAAVKKSLKRCSEQLKAGRRK